MIPTCRGKVDPYALGGRGAGNARCTSSPEHPGSAVHDVGEAPLQTVDLRAAGSLGFQDLSRKLPVGLVSSKDGKWYEYAYLTIL